MCVISNELIGFFLKKIVDFSQATQFFFFANLWVTTQFGARGNLKYMIYFILYKDYLLQNSNLRQK